MNEYTLSIDDGALVLTLTTRSRVRALLRCRWRTEAGTFFMPPSGANACKLGPAAMNQLRRLVREAPPEQYWLQVEQTDGAGFTVPGAELAEVVNAKSAATTV